MYVQTHYYNVIKQRYFPVPGLSLFLCLCFCFYVFALLRMKLYYHVTKEAIYVLVWESHLILLVEIFLSVSTHFFISFKRKCHQLETVNPYLI